MGARPKEIRKEVNHDQLEDQEIQHSEISPPEVNEPPGNIRADILILKLIETRTFGNIKIKNYDRFHQRLCTFARHSVCCTTHDVIKRYSTFISL